MTRRISRGWRSYMSSRHRNVDSQHAPFAELRRAGESTIPARQALLEEHRDDVLDRIAELQRDLQALTDKINLYQP